MSRVTSPLDRSAFAQRFKDCRIAMRPRRTQQALADEVGLTRHTIASYERGLCFPQVHKIEDLEAAFGLNPGGLFSTLPLAEVRVPTKDTPGSSTRELFAAGALAGLLSEAPELMDKVSYARICVRAFELADTMIWASKTVAEVSA